MADYDALPRFVAAMDEVVAREAVPAEITKACAALLPDLLSRPDFLEPRFRRARPERYTQHLLHVHPRGLYSVLSLVWLPGQETPVHDHRCWCVVGVLSGAERETRYDAYARGADHWLVARGTSEYRPGDICQLVPPDEDIHRVTNAGDTKAVSIHVYGADIATVRTSINRTFEDEILDAPPEGAVRRSWRQASGAHPPAAAGASEEA